MMALRVGIASAATAARRVRGYASGLAGLEAHRPLLREGVSYAYGGAQPPLLHDTVGAMFSKQAAAFPDHDALVACHQDIRRSFAELDAEATTLAKGLLRHGMAKGDRLGVWLGNSYEWAMLQLATAKAGIILVNVNPAYRSNELRHALLLTGCKALVFTSNLGKSDNLGVLIKAMPKLAQGKLDKHVPEMSLLIECNDDATAPLSLSHAHCVSFNEVLRSGDVESHYSLPACTPDEPINIQFTSGTTGLPKGATLTHHNIVNNGFFVGRQMRMSNTDRLCIPVPLYHCFGMVMGNLAAWSHGAAVVYSSHSFDADATLKAVQKERCTGLHGVPTMFIGELHHPDFASFDLSSLRTGIMAGTLCPIETMRLVVSKMGLTDMTIGYGMTETSPVSFMTSIDDPLEKRCGTVGKVMPHVLARVVDPATGKDVAHNEKGELYVKGYGVMQGYWNDPVRTEDAIEAGWMKTGDLAVMDKEGYLSIVGRNKDVIIRGGENVFPVEIENFLFTHEKIKNVNVVGVYDEKYGEQICACVELKQGATMTEEDVKDFCKGEIAHYKVPAYVRFVDSYPMTVTGKIQKFLLRDECEEKLRIARPTEN